MVVPVRLHNLTNKQQFLAESTDNPISFLLLLQQSKMEHCSTIFVSVIVLKLFNHFQSNLLIDYKSDRWNFSCEMSIYYSNIPKRVSIIVEDRIEDDVHTRNFMISKHLDIVLMGHSKCIWRNDLLPK